MVPNGAWLSLYAAELQAFLSSVRSSGRRQHADGDGAAAEEIGGGGLDFFGAEGLEDGGHFAVVVDG